MYLTMLQLIEKVQVCFKSSSTEIPLLLSPREMDRLLCTKPLIVQKRRFFLYVSNEKPTQSVSAIRSTA